MDHRTCNLHPAECQDAAHQRTLWLCLFVRFFVLCVSLSKWDTVELSSCYQCLCDFQKVLCFFHSSTTEKCICLCWHISGWNENFPHLLIAQTAGELHNGAAAAVGLRNQMKCTESVDFFHGKTVTGAYRCCFNNRTFCVYTIKCHAAIRNGRKRAFKSLEKGKMRSTLTLAGAFLRALYRRQLGTSVGRDKRESPWRIQHITVNFFPFKSQREAVGAFGCSESRNRCWRWAEGGIRAATQKDVWITYLLDSLSFIVTDNVLQCQKKNALHLRGVFPLVLYPISWISAFPSPEKTEKR